MPHLLLASVTQDLNILYFDPATKILNPAGSYPSGGNLNWLSQSPVDPHIIAGTNANAEKPEVRLFRWSLEGSEVKIEWLGVQSTGEGTRPAHNVILDTGDEVVVANYNGGTVIALPIVSNALVKNEHPSIKCPFSGPGPIPARQESSHPHQAYQHGAEILVPDLGTDKVWRLGRLSTSSEWTIQGAVTCPPGTGPRHVITSGSDLYVLNELANSLSHFTLPTSFTADATHHSTQPCTLRPGPASGAAELLIHPAGTHLYATNRDAGNIAGDSIAIFSLSRTLSTLGAKEPTLVKEVWTGMQHVRGAILKEYEGVLYLVAAGAKGGGVKVYEVTEGGNELVEVAQVDVEQITGFVWI